MKPPGRYRLDGKDLRPDVCWQAVYSRDARFDGRFFAGSLATRIYCRSICPVPFAHPDNIVWFTSAASAETEGFRPCRRCRAAASPDTPAWLGTSALVSRSLRLIAEGALDSGNVETLANRVGVGSRHLRRLFVEHLGASPGRVAITRRVHFARGLLEETELPITDVAACAGFRSLRQFNHAMRTGTGETPTEIRRLRNAPRGLVPRPGLSIRLPYRPPLHWPGLLAFFAARALAEVEFVSPSAYWRTITIGGVAGVIEVRHETADRQLIVAIELPRYESLMQVVERVRRMFDLTADPLQIANQLSRDRILQPYFEANPGLRVPGIWDGFEAAVRVVLGERLTAKGPNAALSKLIRTFGKSIKTSVRSLTHTFPGPENLAEADLEAAGICCESARTIRALAHAVLRHDLSFESSVSLQDTIRRLRILPGISGPMADYIAMRAYGEPDAFPAPAGMAERETENWRPWRAYAAMYLFGAPVRTHLKS